jgi:hypothetical protein
MKRKAVIPAQKAAELKSARTPLREACRDGDPGGCVMSPPAGDVLGRMESEARVVAFAGGISVEE